MRVESFSKSYNIELFSTQDGPGTNQNVSLVYTNSDRSALALGGSGEVHGAEADEEVVEDCHQSLHDRRHFVPQLSRNGQAESDQNTFGAGVRHCKHALHRAGWTAYSGEIRREYTNMFISDYPGGN